ncbi:hypothetical protein ACSFBX_31705 [Variovorax sp. RB2P76]|uniref:hypothetical protein n=1 Tax=Variovorax sp. RB2P76 TaxID=3443736 RepID=UPI003F48C454
MPEQTEANAPSPAVAVNGGGALVEALDLSDLTFEALVDEADAMAATEVLLPVDLRRLQQS